MAFCEENKISKHFETSSMTGHNVEEVFSLAAKELYVEACLKQEAAQAEP